MTDKIRFDKLDKLVSKKYYMLACIRDNSLVYYMDYGHYTSRYKPSESLWCANKPIILPIPAIYGFLNNYIKTLNYWAKKYPLFIQENSYIKKHIGVKKEEFITIPVNNIEDVLIARHFADNYTDAKQLINSLNEWRIQMKNQIAYESNKARVEAIRQFITILKSDNNFSTCYTLREIANNLSIKYSDIEDLDN